MLALFVIVLLPALYLGTVLLRASGGLPQWDGAVEVPGLSAKAQVVRDENGIPFISAETERDLYFAQGFVHAQDRFWQMAITRRAMSGRLAEWFGSSAVRSDRISRMWGWARMARRSFDALPNAERDLLNAYAEGINAWLDSTYYRRPPEMIILHVEPERWRAEDSFLAGYSIHRMFPSAGSEVVQAILSSSGASRDVYDIFDETDLPVRPIIPSKDGQRVVQPTAAYLFPTFSDNWTLAGRHTVSGKPLMANDPQIGPSLPGVWQLQHHTVGERQMAGATLPGLPSIAVGHNGRLAWGMTMANGDATDYAFLQTDSNEPGRYRRGPETEWRSFEQTTETIAVRFGDDIVETIRSTPTGIVWPLDLDSNLIGDRENVTLEIRDVAAETPLTTAGFIQLSRAATVQQGIAAIEGIVAPTLSVSFADTEGNIGYVMAGRVPLRPVSHATQVGFAPEDGNEWELLPFTQNPKVVNPAGGRIVTANHRIVGDDYPHYVSNRWAPPIRAHRVHELLDKVTRHDKQSFVDMQMDSYSAEARDVLPFLLEIDPLSEADRELLEVLRNWDRRFSVDAVGPLVWLTWMERLRERVFSDDLDGAPIRTTRNSAVVRALSGERSKWCDDVSTNATESCELILQESLADARRILTEAFGSDVTTWRWGARAPIHIPHQGFANLPILDSLFSRSVAVPGGPNTLFTNLVNTRLSPRFSATWNVSSYQGVYDLADLDESLFMTFGGSSGHYKSPYYNNLTESWVKGQRLRLSRENLSAAATLVLVSHTED